MSLSRKAARKHVSSGGTQVCPFCGASIEESAEYGELELVEDGGVQQRAECLKCGKKWMDVFRLAEVRELF